MTYIQKIGLFVIIITLFVGLGFIVYSTISKDVPKNNKPFFNTPLKVTSKDLPINEE